MARELAVSQTVILLASPLHPYYTPTKGRGRCSRVTVSPTATESRRPIMCVPREMCALWAEGGRYWGLLKAFKICCADPISNEYQPPT